MAEDELQTQVIEGEPPVVSEGAAPLPPQAEVTSPAPPVAAAPASDSELVTLRRQLAEKETELSTYQKQAERVKTEQRTQQMLQELEPRVQATIRQLVGEGRDEETARLIAYARRDASVAQDMARLEAQDSLEEVMDLAEKHSVSARELLKLPRAQRKLAAASLAREAALAKRVTELEKEKANRAAPPQDFEITQGGQGGGGSAGFNPRTVTLEQLGDPAFYLKHSGAILKAQEAGQLAHLSEIYG